MNRAAMFISLTLVAGVLVIDIYTGDITVSDIFEGVVIACFCMAAMAALVVIATLHLAAMIGVAVIDNIAGAVAVVLGAIVLWIVVASTYFPKIEEGPEAYKSGGCGHLLLNGMLIVPLASTSMPPPQLRSQCRSLCTSGQACV